MLMIKFDFNFFVCVLNFCIAPETREVLMIVLIVTGGRMRGGRGGSRGGGRGRGGRSGGGSNKGKPKTAEELDAELDSYVSEAKSSNTPVEAPDA